MCDEEESIISLGPTAYLQDDKPVIVNLAESQAGKPYKWNTNGPDTYDCSGFIVWLYRRLGYLTEKEDLNTIGLALMHMQVDSPSPGDLCFYGQGHVMLYLGNGKCIGARGGGSSTTTVEAAEAINAKVSVRKVKYRKDFIGYGRRIDTP